MSLYFAFRTRLICALKILDTSFDKLRTNVRVNGRDLEAVDDDAEMALNDGHCPEFPSLPSLTYTAVLGIEPYDTDLHHTVETLSHDKLKWQQNVAQMRTTAPVSLMERFDKLLEEERALSLEEAEFELQLMEMDNDVDEQMHGTLQRVVFFLSFVVTQCILCYRRANMGGKDCRAIPAGIGHGQPVGTGETSQAMLFCSSDLISCLP